MNNLRGRIFRAMALCLAVGSVEAGIGRTADDQVEVASARRVIPTLPDVPRLATAQYPSCQNSWQQGSSRYGRFQLVQQCINQLEQYNVFYLGRFPGQLRAYADSLQQIGSAFLQTNASLGDKQQLIAEIRRRLQRIRSIGNDRTWGDDYNDYYLYVRRYKDDIKSLTDARAHLQNKEI